MRRRMVAGAAIAALVLAGCGDDSSEDLAAWCEAWNAPTFPDFANDPSADQVEAVRAAIEDLAAAAPAEIEEQVEQLTEDAEKVVQAWIDADFDPDEVDRDALIVSPDAGLDVENYADENC